MPVLSQLGLFMSGRGAFSGFIARVLLLFKAKAPFRMNSASKLWRVTAITLATIALASATAQAQVKPFKITGGGVAPEGLPPPGEEGRQHWSVGNATHLGKYTGDGTVAIDTAAFDPVTGTIKGEFGGGSPYTFVAANGDRLVCVYGRTAFGAAVPGTFELTIVGATEEGAPIVHSTFTAEFVVQPELCTGRFAGVTGSWVMYAYSIEPFVLGSSDPISYGWDGEGELTFPKKK